MEENSKFHTVRGYQLLNQDDRFLTSAMEDYLEMIYRNSLVDGYLRINTLSELLNVAAPSATKMVQKLSRRGLLDYQKHGIVSLSDKGKEVGKLLLARHEIVEKFLFNLGVSEDLLVETELIEHNISPATLEKMKYFNSFLLENHDIAERYQQYQPNK